MALDSGGPVLLDPLALHCQLLPAMMVRVLEETSGVDGNERDEGWGPGDDGQGVRDDG